jgi:transglutaminase-like putative cysteine protease
VSEGSVAVEATGRERPHHRGRGRGSSEPRSRPLQWALSLVLAATSTTAAHGEAPHALVRGPLPVWFDPVPVDMAARSTTLTGDLDVLMHDRQVYLGPGRGEAVEVQRWVERAQTVDGVARLAQLEITFDPEYERVVLHRLDVIRDGVRSSRLDSTPPRWVQRESDLSRRIYDGQLSLLLVLSDIRVGDVVESAWSTTGQNPALGGLAGFVHYIGYGSPNRPTSFRLLASPERALRVELTHADAIRHSDALTPHGRARRWWGPARAVVESPGEPVWYRPWPSVEVADAVTWDEVRARVSRHFEPAMQAQSPELAALAATFTASTTEGRLLQAVRFVQHDVRYFGFELGTRALIPHPAPAVLAQRFGDCKDKAVLLTSLLRRLGVEAAPALVHTQRRRTLDDRVPHPGAFDHAIVWTRVGGVERWFDATDDSERGDLRHHDTPPFERALVLDGRQGALTPIPASSTPSVLTVEERFTLGTTPQRLLVRTHATGAHAARLRRELGRGSHAQTERAYLEYYAKRYPSVRLESPLSVGDRPQDDALELVESYTLTDFWDAGRHDVDPYTVAPALTAVRGLAGSSPLALDHPERRSHTTVVLGDTPWAVDDVRRRVDAPGFTWQRDVDREGEALVVRHTYASKTDTIRAADVAEHLRMLARARDQSGYVLTEGGQRRGASDGSPVVFVVMIGAFAAILYFAVRVLSRNEHDPAAARRLRLFQGRLAAAAGDSATTPLAAAPDERWYQRRRCSGCGRKKVLTPAGSDTVLLGEQRLGVIQVTCRQCNARSSVFVRKA